ncbi:GNAT family N-acetyltransferase, partial [Streptomyces stelliscabiei]|uniref:GNAT family N-acetyltransferase n=1 Tax=Streptomyces stelliscabiei TaxID=146820 RepID=UPI000AA029C2
MSVESYGDRVAVHEQVADGFGTVRILPLDARADAGVVHGWVSEPRAGFWGMNGLTEEQVREVYEGLAAYDTHHAYLAVHDGEPVGLLQTYEPEADRVGEAYEVEPGDIGVHVLLAPAGEGGGRPGWSSSGCSSCRWVRRVPPWPPGGPRGPARGGTGGGRSDGTRGGRNRPRTGPRTG